MMTVDSTEKVEASPGFKFTKMDRCDACCAQAYVKVSKDKKDLLFCNHHFRRHEPNFITLGWFIDDQSAVLFEEVANMKKMSDDNF